MIKKIIVSACLLLSLVSFAQEGTSSPYSFYGIGDVRFKGTAESRSMAGIAVEQDSIHINLQNPASFANLKFTTFALGGTYNTTKLKTDSKKENARRTTLDYLAVGLPFGKVGVGFGLIPYSSVGYKIESISADVNINNRRYDGSGGMNKAFLGVGYKISPNFSIGADAQYNFGKIETNSLEFASGVTIGSREMNRADLSGVNFDIGAMYKAKLGKKINLYTSVNYTLENTLTSKNSRNIATVGFNSGFDVGVVDVLDEQNSVVELKFPSKISLSAGIGESQKWLIAGKVAYQKTSGQANSYNDYENVGYGKFGSVSVGGYYIPNYNSFTSYAKRIVYRGGLKFEKTGLVVNGESIDDRGLTLGLGLPITGTISNVNIGFEIGKRGTTASGLVQENYANISVGFSLNDKWFVQRKFQ
ncbi:autotransporter outer membrane beta-barrel domain-containing protein [Flavobacterium sp. XN-5]|uniref:autotransporter outer membrane beta-barrel domain-containing protein n=1 Tax=Flavobacterium sp. XN-5 TaxID=2599390 RepID=UPI0011C94B63|nr:autotransporter outer membrane beta-barrel domain-containing protein [Flavobacterium sp. XN-5]NGY38648.1 autotransporter outer membrane beta-barrel domain-containing protein [Flavobacterium sp. XN-5]